jgi:hypothetical protein
MKSTRRGTLVRATWRQCGAALRVRLRAFVDKSCRTMRGRFVTQKPRSFRRFVAEQAACTPGTPGCGACASNADCADERYCAKPVGDCDAGGTCEPRPDACTREHVPVCGCDGVTYSNRCVAAAKGVNVARPGRCESERCGGFKGVDCPVGEFCELPPRQCNVMDLPGRCVPVPDACILVYDPVCGCDGVTYGNDCDRRAAKAQKAHAGKCRDGCEICEPKTCGGIAGTPCPPGELCDLPAGECHGADLQGVCVDTSGACPEVYQPVCGCDGVTYPNDCARRAAQAQKAHDGKCNLPCADACECEKSAPLPDWCSTLLCPACGCTWVCESGRCDVEVQSPPPPPACTVP